MQVHSTPTASDKHAERRVLSGDVARLKMEKETLERQVNILAVTREEHIKKSGLAPHDYKKVEDIHLKQMRSFEDQVITIKDEISKATKELADIKAAHSQAAIAKTADDKRLLELKGEIERANIAAEEAKANKEKHVQAFDAIIAADDLRLKNIRLAYDEVEQMTISKKTETEKRHTEIMEEERLLAIRRDDLEIYEARLRKQYPNATIIL